MGRLLKMVSLFLTLTLTLIVTAGTQPAETITPSDGDTLSGLLLNWTEIGFKAFLDYLEYVKQGFRINMKNKEASKLLYS